MPSRNRVVITGIGVVAPGGIGVKPFWDLLVSGETATRAISSFDASSYRSQIAAECDFNPAEHGLTTDDGTHQGRAAQFATVAAAEAIAASGITGASVSASRIGVSVGSAVGSVHALDHIYRSLSLDGQRRALDGAAASPNLLDFQTPSSIARELAWQIGAEGPVAMISAGCTSGLDAVGHAYALVQEGSADVVLAGAADAPVTPITVACFDAIKATSPANAEPRQASRPFDRQRNGFVLGEGSAMFVVESLEHARARGVEIIAEIAGFAARCNGYHMTGLRPDGREMASAISESLDQARIMPTDISYINAHGSGTKQNDRHETAAYKLALGAAARTVPISSIKSMIGHSLGAIGSIELAACALALTEGVIPPTANLHDPDPDCDLDYVPLVAREADVDVALSVGSGFGGFQSAALLAKAGWRR